MAREFIMQMRPWIGSEEKHAINSYMEEDGFLTEFKNTKKFEDAIAEFTGAIKLRDSSQRRASVWQCHFGNLPG